MVGPVSLFRKWFTSVTVRITFVLALIAALAVLVVVDFEVSELSKRYREATEEPLVDLANILASLIENSIERDGDRWTSLPPFAGLNALEGRKIRARIFDLEKSDIDIRIYVTDQNGIVVFDSRSPSALGQNYSKWNDVARTLHGQYGSRATREGEGEAVVMLYVAAPIYYQGKIGGAVSIGKPTQSASRFIDAAYDSTVLLASSVISGIIIVSILVGWYFSRPLRRFKRYVEALSRGEHPVPPHLSGYELQSLLDAFESLRAELEGKKYVEHYVQTLTHEIKSPLTAIYGAAELLKESITNSQDQRLLDNVTHESERIKKLIEKMLALSALESGRVRIEKHAISLAEIIEELVGSLSGAIKQREVSIDIKLNSEGKINADRFWIREGIANILQNAIDFAAPGDKLNISLDSDKSLVVVEISDSGPGIPEWALPRIFERFYSLERPASGKRSSGLGLSIAKEVVELHGGTILLKNRSPSGVIARITFPA